MEKKKTTVFFWLCCSIVLLIGCGTSSGLNLSNNVGFGKDDYMNITSANNGLGFLLLNELEPDEKDNLFYSPLSLYMALSMVYNGADKETKTEMAKVLQVEGMETDKLNQANVSLISMLHRDLQGVNISIGNSIWLNQDYRFQADFSEDTRDYFNAELEEIDMRNDKSADKINKWVKKTTNGKIDKMIDSVNPELVTILLNAIYFQGNWTYEFDKNFTEDRTFTDKNGTKRDIPLMTVTEDLPYFETEDFQAVKLPYGKEEAFSMNILLPKEHSNLEKLQEKLTTENWQMWKDGFVPSEGTVLLPKFQLDYEATLNDALEKVGMPSAFNKDKADFSKMIKEKEQIFISQVKQKTFIEVSEQGTEATAATSVEMKLTSAPIDGPFHMEVNRPFFFTITHDITDTILFLGIMNRP